MAGGAPFGGVPFGQYAEDDAQEQILAPFIAPTTVVYAPTLPDQVFAPTIAATTVVYPPVVQSGGTPGRVTNLPVEALVLPDTAKARVTNLPVEVLVQLLNPSARLTNLPVEVLYRNNERTRATVSWVDE